MSRIGKNPIELPEKVQVNVGAKGAVTVEGPKGKLSWTLPENITARIEDGLVKVERVNEPDAGIPPAIALATFAIPTENMS